MFVHRALLHICTHPLVSGLTNNEKWGSCQRKCAEGHPTRWNKSELGHHLSLFSPSPYMCMCANAIIADVYVLALTEGGE